jgi:hypothetical protein
MGPNGLEHLGKFPRQYLLHRLMSHLVYLSFSFTSSRYVDLDRLAFCCLGLSRIGFLVSFGISFFPFTISRYADLICWAFRYHSMCFIVCMPSLTYLSFSITSTSHVHEHSKQNRFISEPFLSSAGVEKAKMVLPTDTRAKPLLRNFLRTRGTNKGLV